MNAVESKQFRIKPRPLRPNHYFMDIHKDKMDSRGGKNIDAFAEFRDYKSRISLLFSDLPDKHKFWFKSGASVKSLHELYEELGTMSEDVFHHHVTSHKNDFAEWIRDVYQDHELAGKLMKAKTRLEARAAIEKRIDSIIDISEQPNEKNFFTALISKLSKENKKLENELAEKKEWLNHKQHDMEAWELRNVEQEKRLYSKYKLMEQQEQHLYDKFRKLQEQEERLNKALSQEKNEIERQKKELQHKQQEQDAMRRSAIFKRHDPVYTRIDELMSYATACIFNKNFKEAKDSMSKVKYYYNTLPNEDPKKKEFYAKIVKLRKYIRDTLKL